MKTIAINVMNLCVPCENRCRYCLLSYDGRIGGIDYDRSTAYAKRFYDWITSNRPDISFSFGFGYSMEHPKLIEAIQFCQSIGSVTGEFLQFDGMKFRTEPELLSLLSSLKTNGVRLIDLTFYGTEAYHDRFAARAGDFKLMMDTLRAANQIDLDVSVSIPLTHENVSQIDDLLDQLEPFRTSRITCFVPHAEGRGKLLDKVRFTIQDYEQLSSKAKSLLSRERFQTETEWFHTPRFPSGERRVLTVTLTPENIDTLEQMDFAETIAWLEQMDDAYYQAVPGFDELRRLYSDPQGNRMYSARDLYMHYQKRYISDHKIDIYDIHDERQCFSRRI